MEKLSVTVCLHQAGPHQLLDVVRDRRFRYGKFLPKFLAGALQFPGNDLQHRHAAGIGQRLGNESELFVAQRRAGSGSFHSSMVIELSSGCQEVTRG